MSAEEKGADIYKQWAKLIITALITGALTYYLGEHKQVIEIEIMQPSVPVQVQK